MGPKRVSISMLAVVIVFPGRAVDAESAERPETVRDRLWVWGNPEMARPVEPSPATFAQASPVERARLLGVPHVILAGAGLPHDRAQAEAWTTDAAAAARLVWEIIPDGQTENNPPFVFERRIAGLAPLVKKHPHIEAVLLDDMTSVAAGKGFRADHIRRIRASIRSRALPLKIWGVLYTMNFPNPHTDALVNALDVINLWNWHAKDTPQLESHVAECEKRYRGKPIVVGLYLYDYGDGRPMPMDLLEGQCETALKLLHARRVEGIVFLTIHNEAQRVQWTADWIRRVGRQTIGKASVPEP